MGTSLSSRVGVPIALTAVAGAIPAIQLLVGGSGGPALWQAGRPAAIQDSGRPGIYLSDGSGRRATFRTGVDDQRPRGPGNPIWVLMELLVRGELEI